MVFIFSKISRKAMLAALGIGCLATVLVLSTGRGDQITDIFDETVDSNSTLVNRTSGRSAQWEAIPLLFPLSPILGLWTRFIEGRRLHLYAQAPPLPFPLSGRNRGNRASGIYSPNMYSRVAISTRRPSFASMGGSYTAGWNYRLCAHRFIGNCVRLRFWNFSRACFYGSRISSQIHRPRVLSYSCRRR